MSHFPHAGPIEERIPGEPMHCHTTLPNHDCPQLRAGCLGCTFDWFQSVPVSPWACSALGLELRITANVQTVAAALARLEERMARP